MAEQSLRERLHATHDPSVEAGKSRGMLLGVLAIGVIAAVAGGIGMGRFWAIPGLILAAACVFVFFARRTRVA